MPEHQQKFVAYHDEEHGLLLGYGEQVSPGQHIKQAAKTYEVEEVHAHSKGLWTASLKVTGKGRSL